MGQLVGAAVQVAKRDRLPLRTDGDGVRALLGERGEQTVQGLIGGEVGLRGIPFDKHPVVFGFGQNGQRGDHLLRVVGYGGQNRLEVRDHPLIVSDLNRSVLYWKWHT